MSETPFSSSSNNSRFKIYSSPAYFDTSFGNWLPGEFDCEEVEAGYANLEFKHKEIFCVFLPSDYVPDDGEDCYDFCREGDVIEKLANFLNSLYNFCKYGDKLDNYAYQEYIDMLEECDSWDKFFADFFEYDIDNSSLEYELKNLNMLEDYELLKSKLK